MKKWPELEGIKLNLFVISFRRLWVIEKEHNILYMNNNIII